MREKGGGRGCLSSFLPGFHHFHFFLSPFPSLSRAHTPGDMCHLQGRGHPPSEITKTTHNTAPFPQNMMFSFMTNQRKVSSVVFQKKKRPMTEEDPEQKQSKVTALHFFFLSKRKEEDAIFFFTDLVTVNDPPPLFLISIKVKCPRVLYKIWPDDPDIFFFFLNLIRTNLIGRYTLFVFQKKIDNFCRVTTHPAWIGNLCSW